MFKEYEREKQRMEADGEKKESIRFIPCIFSCMVSSGVNIQTLRLCSYNQFS